MLLPTRSGTVRSKAGVVVYICPDAIDIWQMYWPVLCLPSQCLSLCKSIIFIYSYLAPAPCQHTLCESPLPHRPPHWKPSANLLLHYTLHAIFHFLSDRLFPGWTFSGLWRLIFCSRALLLLTSRYSIYVIEARGQVTETSNRDGELS